MSKWTEDRVNELQDIVGSERPVSLAAVEAAAAALEVSTRSVSSKLRSLDIEVEKVSAAAPAFSEAQTQALRDFISRNEGLYTYAEVAAAFADGAFSAKQIQGKVLSLELTGSIRKTEKQEVQKSYSDEEEAAVIAAVQSGAFIEDIAAQLGREVNSIRGKVLSLVRAEVLTTFPPQRTTKKVADPVEALGDISGLTVAELAEKLDRTERGVKTLLTRRGIAVKDYDGAARAEKIAAKAA